MIQYRIVKVKSGQYRIQCRENYEAAEASWEWAPKNLAQEIEGIKNFYDSYEEAKEWLDKETIETVMDKSYRN